MGAPLQLENLWFRGLFFGVLESTLAFFIRRNEPASCLQLERMQSLVQFAPNDYLRAKLRE